MQTGTGMAGDCPEKDGKGQAASSMGGKGEEDVSRDML